MTLSRNRPRDRSGALAQSALPDLYIATDIQDKPLMCMPLPMIARQGLYARIILVALFRRDGTLFLKKRPPGHLPHSGRWDLLAAAVKAGEAREDAALRLTAAHAGPAEPSLSLAAARLALPESPFHLSLFVAFLPAGYDFLWTQSPAILAVDADELQGLLQGEAELFTPELAWAVATGQMFKHGKRAFSPPLQP